MSPARPKRLVLLLRGVNVGRNKRIAMADLRALLERLGYEDVRTHLNSGNAIVTTADAPQAVARAAEQAIEAELGHAVGVVVRSAAQLAALVNADPLGAEADDGSRKMVLFLSAKPTAAPLKALTEQDFAPERLVGRGSELHAWCPAGVNDSPLIKAIGAAKLAPLTTARNWNTVTKLLELARS